MVVQIYTANRLKMDIVPIPINCIFDTSAVISALIPYTQSYRYFVSIAGQIMALAVQNDVDNIRRPLFGGL